MREHDVIRLLEPVDGWPAGAEGAIVAPPKPDVLLVEFGAETGKPELVVVPVGSVQIAHSAA